MSRRKDSIKEIHKILFLATVDTHLCYFHIPFMKLLKLKGYDVEAAAAPVDGFKEKKEKEGFVFHSIPFSRNPLHPKNIGAFFRLLQLLKKNKYLLIHTHTPVASFLGRFAAKLAGIPSVLYTAHGFHFFEGAPRKNWLLYYTAEKIVAKWTDALLVMNQEDFENGKKLGFVPGKSLFLVHGVGVDIKRYSQVHEGSTIRDELGISNDSVVITCIAEFNQNKNHDFIIQAWPEIKKKKMNTNLILVGDGELLETMKEKITSSGISSVFFLGKREDIPQILSGSDIGLLVSKREGLPRCIMETMAAGKPVVATDIRGNRDLVEDGVNGYLVKLGDIEDLTHSIIKLAEDVDLRKQMGKKGREMIEAYSLENVLEEMSEIYDKFLE
ncbi:MAG: glycosyltransferase family 4 protein [Candidatus Atribacteria bacterium]|nr:glycosyltransferase family 4 protein [Candidatus Atribacteria bacterium]